MQKKLMLRVVKISGNIIDDKERLDDFLSRFVQIEGAKILVHGGGKMATTLAEKLGIPQTLIDGRRITDTETLRVAVMVYGGLVNKQIVAQLSALGSTAIGVCGADGDLLRAHKRIHPEIDYGWVGDIDRVNVALLDYWLGKNLVPVVAPLTHDGHGQLFNTNADTIAREIAVAMSKAFHVELIYTFEKSGVLRDVNDENSRIETLNPQDYQQLKEAKIITQGMLPKLDNAFSALGRGVKKVIIGQAGQLDLLLAGKHGTTLTNDNDE